MQVGVKKFKQSRCVEIKQLIAFPTLITPVCVEELRLLPTSILSNHVGAYIYRVLTVYLLLLHTVYLLLLLTVSTKGASWLGLGPPNLAHLGSLNLGPVQASKF